MVVQSSFAPVALSQLKEASSGWLMLGKAISGSIPATITPWHTPKDEANHRLRLRKLRRRIFRHDALALVGGGRTGRFYQPAQPLRLHSARPGDCRVGRSLRWGDQAAQQAGLENR